VVTEHTCKILIERERLLKVLSSRTITQLEDDGYVVLGRFRESQQGGQLWRGLAAAVRTDVLAVRSEKIGTNIQLRSLPTNNARGIPETTV